MQYFTQKDGALIFRRRHELWKSGHGERDCASARRKTESLPKGLGAFRTAHVEGRIEVFEDHAEVSNGKIRAVITDFGKMRS